MHRPIFFCRKWFAPKKYAPDVWTEAQARGAHAAGQNYSVLVDSVEKPFCVILVMAEAVATDFLDDRLRVALSYQFQTVSPGRMFLTMAVHREFEEDTVVRGVRYTFTEHGFVTIRRETLSPTHSIDSSTTQTDVSSNYAKVPEFGRYEEFMRMERQLQ